MNRHQVLSGACNAGDQCFAVGSVEGIPFTAYAAGCNIVILASNFERVQIIPGAVHGYVRIGTLDCSTDTGKIAAAYGSEVCVFEPTPLIHTSSSHGLEYRWVQTGRLQASGPITALSWNLEGTRLLTGGDLLQLWHQANLHEDDHQPSSTVTFEIGGSEKDLKPQSDVEEPSWVCVWKCHTATPAYHLAFSPDGTLFATSGKNDRLVKIWYHNKVMFPTKGGENHNNHQELNYSFIYIAHPRAVTHLAWRKTSKYMPKGSVGNMLVTSCLDNICRVWSETLLPEDDWGPGGPPAASRAPGHRHRTTHRHKHRFMQRLKHMKTCFHIRRSAAQSSKTGGTPIPTLPSTYSVHDFHSSYHANSCASGLHFHLAASINAETDIPLVPSMKAPCSGSSQPRFILHWLHNKEMHFTLQAESILHELTRKILEKEEAEEAAMLDGHHQHNEGENENKLRKNVHVHRSSSQDESNSDEHQTGSGNQSHPSLSNTTSINSIATDVTCTHLPDSLDAKIEGLLRDWHNSPDLLFSIHPIDGSFLIWVIDWLDEHVPGAFRQAQVSFSARIPNAFPLGDATTMCTPAALYHTAGAPLYVRQRAARSKPDQANLTSTNDATTPLASVEEEKEELDFQNAENENDAPNEESQQNGGTQESRTEAKSADTTDEEMNNDDVLNTAPCPVISMVTNHTNGTLNLWQLTFADKSKFSQVLSVGHASRASGHRFRVNDVTCHPVLPLLLTTSHHNIADCPETPRQPSPTTLLPPIAPQPREPGGLCSELILWRVDAVGPLNKSGGVSELARVNSPHPSAFSNVAWLPTLLPSSTLGNLCNSPSACFVASDGESLRVYQAVIDARTLLAEIASSERRHRSMMDSVLSLSTESSLCGELTGNASVPLHERIRIVSQQSTARPGCVMQLDAIADATHDWQNTQLLHVFQEQLITGERMSMSDMGDTSQWDPSTVPAPAPLMDSGLDAMVDLQRAATFQEPFYIVVLERTNKGSVVHMWRLVIASQPEAAEDLSSSMMYVPDSALVQDPDEGCDSRKNSVSALDEPSKLRLPQPVPHVTISTTKVCQCELELPAGVEVIHAAPAAGHLSSASIYPACFAPYIVTTACSDRTVRFWKCEVKKNDSGDLDYTWKEWEMMNKDQESTIDIPGQPLNISAAYSGRIACAYKCGSSFTRSTGRNANTSSGAGETQTTTNGVSPRFVNLCVAVYECESTGGAEWLLEDTIPLRNVSLPRADAADAQIDMSYLKDTRFALKKQILTQVLQTLSHEDLRSPRNGDSNSVSSDSSKPAAGLLAVPSFSTLQSLRRSITENGNTCPLTQKHLVQLDWVSKEDGSHILTVAIGSKVLLFTPVSSDLAQANLKAMKESLNSNRPILRKASSLAAPNFVDEIRWMKLRKIDLKTADGLPPLPMQISWVRDGILVVGMDSEMHVYSQWKPESRNGSSNSAHHQTFQDVEEGSDTRNLRDSDLRPSTSQRRLANVSSMPHLSRVSSINLQILERDAKKRKTHTEQPQPMLDYMPEYGLFEASQMACPVLPQYHPKQLMELLNSGKIRWVKAILAHLVRCIGGTSRGSQGDEDSLSRQRGWAARARTLSVSFAAGAASPMDPQSQITEEVQLDYAEITSVPPLPLWTLLVADKETPGHPSAAKETKDYNELFDGNMSIDEDLDELLMEEEADEPTSKRGDRRPSVPERQGLSHFGPRQGRILSRLLTHTHLPGLSSLDQMHLLALADTVSTCNTDFAERFAIDAARTAISKENASGMPLGDEMSTDALDDCGLRFLMAMKHYGYLLRCLPLAQRAALQRGGVNTCNIVWAFHSESHEQLLALVPSYAKGQPKWSTLKELGVGWWLRSPSLLRTCVERLARAAYQAQQDPMDAALYYLAMRKKALLWGLFRSRKDEKMTAFFANNFAEERWRKAALKNAFALLGKQRFEHAAAFFLLGGALKDALEVLLTRLGDLQLAMIVARLYEADSQMPDSLKQLLYEEILGCSADGSVCEIERAHPDPFLRSMALWQLRQHSSALATLLEASAGRLHNARSQPVAPPTSSPASPHADPSVFNFYVYLRTHPLLVRQNVAAQGGAVGLLQEGEEGITRLERRLYFTTAHGHFKGGCPALALEVLSKLPAKILDDKVPGETLKVERDLQEEKKDVLIQSGQLQWGDTDSSKADAMDWGAPVSSTADDELELKWDDDDEDADKLSEGSSTPALALNIDGKKGDGEENTESEEKENKAQGLDIMAQQLKFIACLKILMEELSTLATGFEVDGGHLRYQLYIWLEREVEALRHLCNYSIYTDGSEEGCAGGGAAGGGQLNAPEDPPAQYERPTLHQVLLQEKMDFEAKVQRAVRRKRWLKANETLLRTLLSYCSLQGAGGGGLASVRMELILLLQELGQEKAQQQQLLSPLPFPTTLPLLSAAVACCKTVVADPVRHLQAQAHDMLQTLAELPVSSRGSPHFATLFTLRDLAVALSACIYQSLCDSDTFSLKHTHQPENLGGMESLAKLSGVSAQSSHLMGQRHRRYSIDEPAPVSTLPNKWPGVSSLRALAARAADDEDAPRLPVLLTEAFVAVFGALLCYALATRDAHLLYRLTALQPTPYLWATLFGGGVKRLLRTAAINNNTVTLDRTEGASVWSSLRAQRARLNIKLLGSTAAAPHTNAAGTTIQEGRPTYREQFVPPQMSMLSYMLVKPAVPDDPDYCDYDSAGSVMSDAEDSGSEPEDDDVFDTGPSALAAARESERRRRKENAEHSDPDSYSWLVMRVATLRIAQQRLQEFLQIAGIEMQELATTSPLVHGALRRMAQWQQSLLESLSARESPPHYIPGCFPEQKQGGPPINKYRCLLEKHNSPFNSNLFSAQPATRLWMFLVHQEIVQDIFIRAVFVKKQSFSYNSNLEDGKESSGEQQQGHTESTQHGSHGAHDTTDGDTLNPVRIIHKEQDSISAFCLNQVSGGLLAVATPREVQEMNIELLLRGASCWAEDECELDLLALGTDPAALPDTGFLVIQHSHDKNPMNPSSGTGTGTSSPQAPSTPQPPAGMAGQTGRGASVMKGLQFPGCQDAKYCRLIIHRSKLLMQPVLKHKIDNIKRMSAHPILPLYLTGGQDGSVQMWEWGHTTAVWSPRAPGTFAKVTRVRFSEHGNKFGVADGDGNMSLWQVGPAAAAGRPFFTYQCHNKGISDFVFLGSCSLVATVGHSSENKNVAIWDSLMPQKKAMVVAWTCHEAGASCAAFAAGHGTLVTGGRRGDVCVWDVRARAARHRYQAHDSPVKCVALSPAEECFATGAASGDIKVWSLSGHQMLHWFVGEHARSSFFKHIGQGVTQLQIDASGRLFSCGADGTMKVRKLPDKEPTQAHAHTQHAPHSYNVSAPTH